MAVTRQELGWAELASREYKRRMRKQKERRTAGASHLATQLAAEKEANNGIQKTEEDKNPEAKDRWVNLC